MNKILNITIGLISLLTFGQSNDKVIFLDSLYLETNNKDYKYKRVIEDYNPDKNIYFVKEYYKNGNLKSETNYKNYKNEDLRTVEGLKKMYHENGNLHKTYNYENDTIVGEFKQYNKNGNLEMVGEYFKTKEEPYYKIYTYIDKNGKKTIENGNGYYKGTDGGVNLEGEIKNGYKEGLWKGYDTKYHYNYEETYKNGVLVNGISTDKKNVKYTYTERKENISLKDKKNGENDLKNFISPKITALYKTGKYNFKTNVKILIIMNEKGKFVELKSLDKTDDNLDNELIKILKQTEKFFSPEKYRGISIQGYFIMPFNFAN